jgi:hypothetical protein
MLVVDYTINGKTVSKEFPETARGSSASIKYIQQLYADRKNHPWYYRLKQIESLEYRFESTSGKKKMQIKSELFREKKEREEHLHLCEVDSPPQLIELHIYRR